MSSTPCACIKLRRSARTLTALYDAAIQPTGLTTTQFSLLRTLDRAGPCSLSGLADHTGHDRTSISRMIATLVDRDLARFAAGRDQRERIATITPQGRQATEAARAGWEAAQARIDALLGPDQATLFRLLDRIEAIEGEVRP